jgi:hypothetical protein
MAVKRVKVDYKKRAAKAAKTRAAKKATANKIPAPMPLPSPVDQLNYPHTQQWETATNYLDSKAAEGLSPAMSALLAGDLDLMIVKAPKGSIENKEAFAEEMKLSGFRVVFLEYGFSGPPIIERFSK